MVRKSAIKKRKKKKAIMTISLMTISLCLVIQVQCFYEKEKEDQLIEKEEILKAQIAKEEEKKAEIQQEKNYMKTKEYIEEMAKEKFGLVYPNQIILKPK